MPFHASILLNMNILYVQYVWIEVNNITILFVINYNLTMNDKVHSILYSRLIDCLIKQFTVFYNTDMLRYMDR